VLDAIDKLKYNML